MESIDTGKNNGFRYKKEFIGSKVYVELMRNYFEVNEENKDLFIHAGHFELFDHEHIDTKKPVKIDLSNPSRVDRSGASEELPVRVHKRSKRERS